jgi:hypothetical protein
VPLLPPGRRGTLSPSLDHRPKYISWLYPHKKRPWILHTATLAKLSYRPDDDPVRGRNIIAKAKYIYAIHNRMDPNDSKRTVLIHHHENLNSCTLSYTLPHTSIPAHYSSSAYMCGYTAVKQWKVKMYYSTMHSKLCSTSAYFSGSKNYHLIYMKNHKHHKTVLRGGNNIHLLNRFSSRLSLMSF